MSGSDQQQQPYEIIPFEGFSGGLNTEASRYGIKDNEMAWCDGFMPVGENYLRTIPGLGAAIFSSPSNGVAQFQFANLEFTPIMVVFLNDGSLYQVNLTNNALTAMAGPGTIANPSASQSGITQWGSQYVIIVSNQPNGYYLWDGAVFYTPGATAPDGSPMPTGVGGTAAETYQGRVFVTSGPQVFYSAPQSYTDYSTANGGGIFDSFDSFLRVIYVKPVQTNGFLYLIADSSINYIAGITTGGSPLTTTFTNQNADPEVGTPYASAIDVLSSNIVMANAWGIHVAYGGRVQKVSRQLDGVYNTVPNFDGAQLSSAKHILYGKRVYLALVPVIDPISAAQISKLFLWDEKKWWSTQQDTALVFINSNEFFSILSAYGTDGFSIFPLFASPTVAFAKTARSKLWEQPGGYMVNKSADRVWLATQYASAAAPNVTVSIDSENATTAVTLAPNGAFTTGYWIAPPTAIGMTGNMLGMTIVTDAADMALLSASFAAREVGYRG